ncbi:MAG TPA: transcriptional activator NhaR [Myxococcales bacterium]|nr:transcriptional activator NhaR [Myxococcales bacterium]
MEWLNYHHLLYFWTVAREGSIARASVELRLAQPTISGQIRQLEQVLGDPLFVRKGRNLALTELGRVVFRYAEDIFALGRELMDEVRGRATGRPLRLMVGVDDVLPKAIVRLLLQPARSLEKPVRLVCREDRSFDEFLAELATFSLDMVLSDTPVGPGAQVRAFNHLLGECGTTFFAGPRLARAHRKAFPRSLEGAPLLVPGARSTARRALDQWLHAQEIRPAIAGEFDDPALMNLFGEDGLGLMAAPAVLEEDLRRRYHLEVVGRVDGLRQRFYAVSVERKLKHPAVVAICESARRELFA